ncbi:MAG: hypothetical protein NT066_01445 [Candidatus Omnitrophica bacterium]|nr:hypothetical protein [Candidatus Omnitrophota bacterium]
MPKQKVSIGFRILHWFTNHPWLKLIALCLAIIVWFYVRDKISGFNY